MYGPVDPAYVRILKAVFKDDQRFGCGFGSSMVLVVIGVQQDTSGKGYESGSGTSSP
ncbi:MAG: hypothetical protein P8O22_10675 [Akkermansiaceae bacterium]|nr:hypothetical protein [Akkermansiaceae bacterium]